MFGGIGLEICDGVFFGIIARDELYLKVDDLTRGDFERAGMHPFAVPAGRASSMTYYAVPLAVLESGMELTRWAKRAVLAASGEARGRPPAPAGSRRVALSLSPKRKGPTLSHRAFEELIPAVTYSPTHFRMQYHRR